MPSCDGGNARGVARAPRKAFDTLLFVKCVHEERTYENHIVTALWRLVFLSYNTTASPKKVMTTTIEFLPFPSLLQKKKLIPSMIPCILLQTLLFSFTQCYKNSLAILLVHLLFPIIWTVAKGPLLHPWLFPVIPSHVGW